MGLSFKDSKFYLIFIVIFIITNVFSDSSTTRYAVVSAVANNKLYILGGQDAVKVSTDSLFYVDLTKDFDSTNVPWVDGNNIPIGISWSVGAVGGSNKSTIFLFGGVMRNSITNNYDFTNLLYAYDVSTKIWNAPKTTGIIPVNRRDSSAVVNGNGKMYIFGGVADKFTGSSTAQGFNDMYILNTVDLTWHQVFSNNPPSPTSDHTSTLLPDGRIVIIGGGDNVLTDMYKISIFDTNSSTWSIMIPNGPPAIQPRIYHSAVLSKDGKIIVYGGTKFPLETTPFPEILVLDTTMNPFQWSVPNFSSVNRAPPLMAHTANLIGNQMIICFGKITNNFTGSQSSSANTYILDIKDFTWKTSYSASEANPPSTTSTTSTSSTISTILTSATTSEASSSQPETSTASLVNTVQILVIMISILSGIMVIAIVAFIVRKLYQKKRRPGDGSIPSEEQLQQHRNSQLPNPLR